METKIIRSEKRRRTISAKVVDGVMYINAPVNIPDERLQKIIKNFKLRFEKRELKKELNKTHNLMEIFQRLNERYFDGKIQINTIEYSANQDKRFGCCNYKTKVIRISHQLAQMPDWVRDYVIIHEMAHIIEPNHSKLFWDIVNRYSLAERSRGYLIAKGFESEQEADIENNEEKSNT